MVFSESISRAISHCLQNGVPFVAYRLPGDEVVFFADNGSKNSSSRSFTINFWNSLNTSNIIVNDCLDANAVIDIVGTPTCNGLPESTSKSEYINKLSRLIEHLKCRGGKTVISRTLVGATNDCNWAQKAELLFEKFPNAFCHVYYTPKTGAWMGATPEVLLSVDEKGNYNTMALAGTHLIGQEWDNKNRDEQQMVTDFIKEILTPLSQTMTVFPVENLQYGNIEHLCSRFEGQFKNDIQPIDAIAALSPTPAVSGFPRINALKEIEQIESHKRECYSGYIAVRDNNRLNAYVNLRCMQFNVQGDYCLYAGGGITAESNPESEWEETNSKLSSLLTIVKD